MTVRYNSQFPPTDREGSVEVIKRPGVYSRRRVVRRPVAEQRLLVSRVVAVLWLMFGFLEALIGMRIGLKLIGANPAAFFSQIVYRVSDMFLWPFNGLTGNPSVGAFKLEITAIIGLFVYTLIAWGLTRLIWVLFYRPGTSEVTSYRVERK
jgi:hypothetical protein